MMQNYNFPICKSPKIFIRITWIVKFLVRKILSVTVDDFFKPTYKLTNFCLLT